jgi:uncharacterized protein YqhQ
MKEKELKLPAYGGQALIEGVMMRGKHALGVAMRAPDGEIVIKTEKLPAIYASNFRKVPFLRGSILLLDAMGLGMRILTDSANLQTGEDDKIEGYQLVLTVLFSLTISILLFFVLPTVVAELLSRWIPMQPWVSNLIEGVIRLVFIVTYVWGVGLIKDIQRVYAYHGAEHKTINAFENNIPLIPSEVKKCSREHPRCGTSFILAVAVVAIIVFTFIGPLPVLWRILTRIVLIPVIAGIAYEYTRFLANNMENKIVYTIAKPNLALQQLTTREPDESMLEVAIAAFNAMIEKEQNEPINRTTNKEREPI